MKKLLTIVAFLFTIKSYSQDSVVVVIHPQYRDMEFLGITISGDYFLENIYDSLKVKFRIPSPPTGTTTAPLGAYTVDWVNLMTRLKNDPAAIKGGTAGRIEILLRGINQVFLTSRLDALDASDAAAFQAFRLAGRQRLRRL